MAYTEIIMNGKSSQITWHWNMCQMFHFNYFKRFLQNSELNSDEAAEVK